MAFRWRAVDGPLIVVWIISLLINLENKNKTLLKLDPSDKTFWIRADHLAVIGVVRLRPTIQKVKPRTVHLYSKANWEGMRQGMQEFQATFLATC